MHSLLGPSHVTLIAAADLPPKPARDMPGKLLLKKNVFMGRELKRRNEQKKSYGKAFPEFDEASKTYGAGAVRV